FLLWAGDILFVYGVSGWFVIKYLESDSNVLLKRGFAFTLLSAVITLLVISSVPDEIIYRDTAQFIELYNPHYIDYFISNLAMNTLMLVM
ncbi:hypothetical protein, partial [Psychrobacter sp. TB20-MNA-CIBAN-0197]